MVSGDTQAFTVNPWVCVGHKLVGYLGLVHHMVCLGKPDLWPEWLVHTFVHVSCIPSITSPGSWVGDREPPEIYCRDCNQISKFLVRLLLERLSNNYM